MTKSWLEKAIDEYWDTVHKANAECQRIKEEALTKLEKADADMEAEIQTGCSKCHVNTWCTRDKTGEYTCPKCKGRRQDNGSRGKNDKEGTYHNILKEQGYTLDALIEEVGNGKATTGN